MTVAAAQTSTAGPAPRRSNGVLAAFSAACLPYAALGLPVYVTLPEFYASHVGVSLGAVGVIFLVIRLADIFVDPALGMVIDRTHSRFGRYRLWMGIAAPVLMLAVAMLFMVRPGAGPGYLALWLIVLSLGFSVSTLSQVSWAAALSPDYNQRSRIYGWWQTANIIGVLTVLMIPVLVQSMGWGNYAEAVRWQGWFIIVALPLSLAVTFTFTPEPAAGPPAGAAPRFAYLKLFRLPVMKRLLASDLLLGVSRGVVGALFFYFFEAVQGFERAQTSILLLVYFVAGLAGAPVWSFLAVKLGKHRALTVACIYFAVTLLAASFGAPWLAGLIGGGQMIVAGAMVALVGLAFASGDLLLRAMMADVSDQVRLQEGADRTGLLFSILTATSKLGYAASVLTFTALQFAGFDPARGGANSAASLIWLQILFAVLPAVCLMAAALVLRGYPLTQERHTEIRAALEAAGAARQACRMPDSAERPIDRLIGIMARLRDPVGGCPWDVEQTFATIAPYTLEEAYEVADAIERGDMDELKSELGDLLFQTVFHARMAEEQGLFAFDDVANAIADKLERRHPHVFGDEAAKADGVAQKARWEDIKAAERVAKAQHGVLDDVPVGLPALARAAKLTKRAARVGFDWPSTDEVFDKLDEEVAELRVEIAAGDLDKARDEVGDLLFVVANLARKLGVEPEDALRGANAKFVRRFGFIEAELARDGRGPEQSDLAEMDGLWDAAKAAERG